MRATLVLALLATTLGTPGCKRARHKAATTTPGWLLCMRSPSEPTGYVAALRTWLGDRGQLTVLPGPGDLRFIRVRTTSGALRALAMPPDPTEPTTTLTCRATGDWHADCIPATPAAGAHYLAAFDVTPATAVKDVADITTRRLALIADLGAALLTTTDGRIYIITARGLTGLPAYLTQRKPDDVLPEDADPALHAAAPKRPPITKTIQVLPAFLPPVGIIRTEEPPDPFAADAGAP